MVIIFSFVDRHYAMVIEMMRLIIYESLSKGGCNRANTEQGELPGHWM